MAGADAQTVLCDPCLGLSSTYPWPFMFATVATLHIFLVEFALKKYYNWRTSRIAAAAAGQDAGNPKTAEAADVEAVRNLLPNACLNSFAVLTLQPQ